MLSGCRNNSAAGNALWARGFSARPGTTAAAAGVAVDARGNVFVAGLFHGEIDVGLGPLRSSSPQGYASDDLVVLKLDPLGAPRWAHHYPHVSRAALAVDPSGGIVVTGAVYGDSDFGGGLVASSATHAELFFFKLDDAGQHVFSRRFASDSHVLANSVAVSPQGDITIAGSLAGSIDVGGGVLVKDCCGYDLFVAGFDAEGKHRFSLTSGSEGGVDLYSPALAALSDGGVVVSANFSGSISFGGLGVTAPPQPEPKTQFERHFGAPIVSNIFLARLDPKGHIVWSKQPGSSGDQSLRAVAADGAGRVLVWGESNGPVDFGLGPLTGERTDFVLASVNVDGKTAWAKRFTGKTLLIPATQHAHRMAAGAGATAVAGRVAGRVDWGAGQLSGDGDTFIARFSTDGRHNWSKVLPSTVNAYVEGLAIDAAGNVIAAGTFTGDVDLGGAKLSALRPGGPSTSSTALADSDAFIVKFAAR